MVGTLFVPLAVLTATAVAVSTKWGAPSIFNSGPQGFSESLYAYISQTNNNGSAFAGYTGFVQPADASAFGISFANVMGGLAMLFGRYGPMIAALAVAGALAALPWHGRAPRGGPWWFGAGVLLATAMDPFAGVVAAGALVTLSLPPPQPPSATATAAASAAQRTAGRGMRDMIPRRCACSPSAAPPRSTATRPTRSSAPPRR